MSYAVDLDQLDVELTTIGDTQLTLTLLAVPTDGALVSVEVLYRPVGVGAWSTALFSSLSINTTLVITGLTESTRYELFARCLSASDESNPDGFVVFYTRSSSQPAADPINERILDNIVTALGSIVQGPGYFNTLVEATRRNLSNFESMNQPCALVYVEDSDEEVITNGLTQRVLLHTVIQVHFRDFADIDQACSRWIHDVKKAVGQDDTVGGLAVNSEVKSTVAVHSEDQPGVGAVIVFLDVVYRHLRTDPTLVRC